uniref:Uncharacterized protein n=1 Tax=Oryza glumipatula TaxID=40148 RepID=A0A0D9YHD5_9ORYZ
MATDMTTRSALQSARASPSIAATFTLSDVTNSANTAWASAPPPGEAPGSDVAGGGGLDRRRGGAKGSGCAGGRRPCGSHVGGGSALPRTRVGRRRRRPETKGGAERGRSERAKGSSWPGGAIPSFVLSSGEGEAGGVSGSDG